MITLDIFGPGPNKKLDEAVGLDRSKVPNYPRDPATVQHRIDTAKAILSDPKSDPDSRQVAAAILAQHKDIKEYGDTARGQKMLTKVQKRAVDRMIKADDKRDAKAAKKNQDTANRAWDRMTDKDVAESAGDIGREIIALYKKIYRLGDDAVDHVYHTYPTFRKLWNNYEGDLRSIVAEVNPMVLQKLHNELLAAAQEEGLLEQGVAEGATGVQSNIDTSSPNFNHLLYMLRNDYPVPRGRLINKVMMNGQWLDPDEVKELVKSNQLWKGLGYGQEGYNVRGQGPGEKVYEQGVAKQPVNEISPHDFDSDEDYYAAMKRTPRVPRGRSADDYDDYIDEPQDHGDDESYYEKYVRTKGLEERQAAGKKKDSEPEVTDVGLQRAISKSRAAFPTAQSGVQALMKDFMQGQEKDQQEFAKVRRADRRQDQLLAQISQLDKEQEKELQDLDKENNTLAQRLQQLQSVNDKLQQTLATMSGRKEKPKAEKPADTKPVDKPSVNITTPASQPVSARPKKEKTPSSMAATAKQLSAPKKADPMAAMAQRIQQGDQSITDKITGQKSLAFEPTDNVIVPKLQKKKYEPTADITDVEPKYYADLTSKIAKQAITDPEAAAQTYSVRENNKEQEADYGDKYQDMVARVGQKAREQEKKKPVDIKDLARRLAAVKLKDEK